MNTQSKKEHFQKGENIITSKEKIMKTCAHKREGWLPKEWKGFF